MKQDEEETKYPGDIELCDDSTKMEMYQSLHELDNLMDDKWYIRPSDGQVIETTDQLTKT